MAKRRDASLTPHEDESLKHFLLLDFFRYVFFTESPSFASDFIKYTLIIRVIQLYPDKNK